MDPRRVDQGLQHEAVGGQLQQMEDVRPVGFLLPHEWLHALKGSGIPPPSTRGILPQDPAARIRPKQATSAGLEDKEDRMCPLECVPIND